MDKKLLCSLKEHEAPKSTLPCKYILTATNETVNNQSVLFLSLWQAKKINNNPDFKVYLYKDGYISQKLNKDEYKWSEACLENLSGCYNYCWLNKKNTDIYHYALKDKEAVEKFLNKKLNPDEVYLAIDEFQKKLMKEKLDAKRKRISDKIDEAMSKVPELPKDFDKWVYNGPLGFSRYIYYRREKKKIIGFCTECKKEFVIPESKLTHKKIKHNNPGICPICKRKIRYKAAGISKNVEDRTEFVILQKYDDCFIARYFWCKKGYEEHYAHPTIDYYEKVRAIYSLNDNNLSIKKYEHTFFYDTGKIRWCNDLGKIEYDSKPYLYTRNLKSIIKGTAWKYSCLFEYAKKEKYVNTEVFLKEYLKHPAIEYLIKLKLFKFLDDKLNYSWNSWNDVNFKGHNIKEIFGIDKQQFHQMQKLNLGERGLKLIKSISEKGKKLTDLQIKWILNNIESFSCFYDMLDYSTPAKIINYIKKQYIKYNGEPKQRNYIDHNSVLTMLDDYLKDCKTLKIDINNEQVFFPKDLHKAHQHTNKQIQINKNKKYDAMIQKRKKSLEKYIFQDEHYLIRPAVSSLDLIEEGSQLNHCVATHYTIPYAEGRTNILLVRKVSEPDKPFCTVEVRDNEVRQAYIKDDRIPSKETMDFIEKFKKAKLTKRKKVKLSA